MTLRRRVVIVEVPLYPNTLPLTSGYLQAYACRDAEVSGAFDFIIHSRSVSHPAEKLVAELLELDGDVYAMSCYLWNMRRIQTVLEALLTARPNARILLGGPQVMHHIADYVAPRHENMAVADAEGEPTFAAYLGQLLRPRPDFRHVPGLSFWQDGTLISTDKPDRMRELDEIPSPFAAGIFDGNDYTFAVVETNRGCPFSCTYCYWGAATNDKVHRWDLERVKNDLTWISEHGIESIFLADANWGALPRDVELTRHLVACKERNGYPLMVNMQAAKNRPDRVTEITEILVAGGMLTSQPVSLQTVSPQALQLVDRANIKESTYITLQSKLHEKKISSYTELIWPLPGETLDSFQQGIGKLCHSGAGTVVTYPQLLLRNTPMERQRELLGIETIRVTDDASEADVVVGTNWVSRQEYERGVWFYYAVVTLYNARAAHYTASYLDASGSCGYTDLFDAAVRFFSEHTGNPLCRFFADSVATGAQYDINNIGKALHLALHTHRGELDALLMEFLEASPWWQDPMVRVLAEVDLLARPYVFREPVVLPSVRLREVTAQRSDRYLIDVRLPGEALAHLRDAGLPVADPAGEVSVRLNHYGRRKMPYPRQRSLDHNAAYCQAMMNRLEDIVPTWSAPAAVE
ncbi:MAG: B12-binding domain-containing radical SAM protein [Jatrophihabitantaceae bacterium]